MIFNVWKIKKLFSDVVRTLAEKEATRTATTEETREVLLNKSRYNFNKNTVPSLNSTGA